MSVGLRGVGKALGTPAAAIAAVLVWELAVRLLNVPRYILPAPSDVVAVIARYPAYLMANLLETLYTATIGLALAAVTSMVLGLALAYSEALRSAVYPVIVGFNAIPRAALVPILVIWFGLGPIPRILTAFLIAFFPILVPTLTAMITVERELWELLVSFGATRGQILTKVALPRATPYFLSSLQAGFTGSLVGTVIAEMVASDKGLGYVLLSSMSRLDTPLAFACLVLLSAVALAVSRGFMAVERSAAKWAYKAGQ